MELTTVTPNEAVFHEGTLVHRIQNLAAAQVHEHHGIRFETLPELGRQLSRFATVNDVHFGEVLCGVMEDRGMQPILSVEPGATPYPEFMNAGAIAEMGAIDPDCVLVKGDLTHAGTMPEYESFLQFYGAAFGDRLHHIRGNHDAALSDRVAFNNRHCMELDGVTLVTIDTIRPGSDGGTVYDQDLEWLDAIAVSATGPVLVFSHHHIWDPSTAYRSANYFGIQPDESEKFIALVARRPAIRGCFAGHTHRNRVRYFPATGTVPWVEVACVKDFPGTWAEYQVRSEGILQINHRISSPEALAWTDKTRAIYNGTYEAYALGLLSDRCFVVTRY